MVECAQGACGTCPSSSATMKMGIERALKAAFGDQLLAVEQVEAVDTAATLIAVDGHLDMLRPAIKNYGGTVKVCCCYTPRHTIIENLLIYMLMSFHPSPLK
jgi:Fe-S cluster biogenesis protein NfuA